MAKKCIPGVLCIENITLFVVIVLGICVFYLYYVHFSKAGGWSVFGSGENKQNYWVNTIWSYGASDRLSTPSDGVFENPYVPPLKTVDIRGPPISLGISSSVPTTAIPVNIRTNSANTPYRQVGILTSENESEGGAKSDTLILPLMGRDLLNGRDKWQYYTMANGVGSINSKLPIRVNGKSGTGEYGCDSVSNGDTVFVEGYNDKFRATVYDNASISYIPL